MKDSLEIDQSNFWRDFYLVKLYLSGSDIEHTEASTDSSIGQRVIKTEQRFDNRFLGNLDSKHDFHNWLFGRLIFFENY